MSKWWNDLIDKYGVEGANEALKLLSKKGRTELTEDKRSDYAKENYPVLESNLFGGAHGWDDVAGLDLGIMHEYYPNMSEEAVYNKTTNIPKGYEDIFGYPAVADITAGVAGAGGDFAGAKAGTDMYGLLKINEGIADYNVAQAQDPLTDSNLRSFTTSSDIGEFAEGGGLDGTGYQAIQTEKSERAFLPDMSIVETAARESHKKMKDGDVTDILPEGSYIASDKVFLEKKDYEDFIMNTFMSEYKEGKKPEMPKEEYFSDLFTKNKMSIYELGGEIQKKFSVTDREDDAMTLKGNIANKQSRTKWLQKLVEEAEVKKPKTKKADNEFKFGGKVQKFGLGGDILEGINALGSSIPVIGGLFDYASAARQEKKSEKVLEEAYAKQRSLLGMGTGLGVLSSLSQSTDIPARDFSLQESYYDQLGKKTSPQVKEAGIHALTSVPRAQSEAAFKGTSNFNRAVDVLDSLQSRTVPGINTLLTNINTQDKLREESATRLRGDLAGTKAATRTAEATAAITAKNAQIVNTFNPMISGLTEEGKLTAAEAEQQLALSAASQAAKNAATGRVTQELFDVGNLAISGYKAFAPAEYGGRVGDLDKFEEGGEVKKELTNIGSMFLTGDIEQPTGSFIGGSNQQMMQSGSMFLPKSYGETKEKTAEESLARITALLDSLDKKKRVVAQAQSLSRNLELPKTELDKIDRTKVGGEEEILAYLLDVGSTREFTPEETDIFLNLA